MYKKIIMSRFGGLGDMVMLTPILRGIKTLLPEAKLIVVGEENARALMEGCPFVDEYLGFDKSYKSSWNIIKKLWRADIVYLMDTLYRISIIYWLARVKKRIGFPHKRKFFLTDLISAKSWMNYAYEPVVYADFVKDILQIDITQIPEWDRLFYPEGSELEKQNVNELLKNRLYDDFIVCSLETGGYPKDWPIEHWLELFRELEKIEKSVVIIGVPSKKYNNTEFPDNVLDLRGRTNLLETGEVIRLADMVVNGCSFPIHVANAVNTPVIGLYGSEPDWRCRPQRIFASIRAEMDCSPCDYMFKGPGWCENPICMKQISVNRVITEIQRCYDEGKPLGEYQLITGENDG